MNVKIISDSTCDLSPELLKKYDIAVIPLSINMEEKTGKDGIDVTPEDIYEFVAKSGKLPTTSAVNVADYAEVFKYWHDQGYSVVHFTISSEFSSTYQNACIAAENFNNVFVVDSRNLSTGQGLLVLHAAEMAQKGHNAMEIFEQCTKLAKKVEASFVIDSLNYLYKGGRCSAVSALGANLLRLKPCIEVVDGKMDVGKKYRGKFDKVILDYVTERLTGRDDIDKTRIFITHTKCQPEVIKAVEKKVREICPDFGEFLETTAGCTVTTHCGPNTLGILFIRK